MYGISAKSGILPQSAQPTIHKSSPLLYGLADALSTGYASYLLFLPCFSSENSWAFRNGQRHEAQSAYSSHVICSSFGSHAKAQ